MRTDICTHPDRPHNSHPHPHLHPHNSFNIVPSPPHPSIPQTTVSIPIPIKDRKIKSRSATTHLAKTTKYSTEYREIDNMGDIRRLSNQYKQLLLHFHTRAFVVYTIRHRYRSFTAKLCHSSHGTTVNAVPIPTCMAVSVIKLTPLPRYYRLCTVIPIPT